MDELPKLNETAGALDRTLGGLLRRTPVTCNPECTLEQALTRMNELAIGSIIVVDKDQRPLGIFTLPDLLKRVVLPRRDLALPLKDVLSTDLVTLPSHATAYEAALVMVRRGIRHVLVVDEGRLTGVISEKDLFHLQRVSLRQLSGDIQHAPDVETLKQLAGETRVLARQLLTQGTTSERITPLIASLNDLVTRRLIDLLFVPDAPAEAQWCWLALGSEGRFEQTLATDQDNGLIFVPPPDAAVADALRARFLPLAQRVNEALAECGFPLCKGGVMASNPKWCLSDREWRETFSGWIDRGDPRALLNSTIFFDFRALHGTAALAEELRAWLLSHAQANPRFLHQMASNALQNRPPLGLVRDFALSGEGEQSGTIDVKLNGAMLFTDAARILSLAAGVSATHTSDRLRESAQALKIPEAEAAGWIKAFDFLQTLRLRHQLDQLEAGRTADNRLRPYALNPLDRHTLKEALRHAKRVQDRLALDYRL